MTDILLDIDIDKELGLKSHWQATLGLDTMEMTLRKEIPPPPCNVTLKWKIYTKLRVTHVLIFRDDQLVHKEPFQREWRFTQWDTFILHLQLVIGG